MLVLYSGVLIHKNDPTSFKLFTKKSDCGCLAIKYLKILKKKRKKVSRRKSKAEMKSKRRKSKTEI